MSYAYKRKQASIKAEATKRAKLKAEYETKINHLQAMIPKPPRYTYQATCNMTYFKPLKDVMEYKGNEPPTTAFMDNFWGYVAYRIKGRHYQGHRNWHVYTWAGFPGEDDN